jgi:hypothetical protein
MVKDTTRLTSQIVAKVRNRALTTVAIPRINDGLDRLGYPSNCPPTPKRARTEHLKFKARRMAGREPGADGVSL